MNRRASAPPPKSSSRTGWTVVLVALASAAAAFILGRGFSNNSNKSSGSTGNTAATASGSKGKTSTTVPSSATAASAAPTSTTIAPASIKVVVLNGNGVKGSAGARATELVALGFVAKADNATKNDYAATAVYFVSAADQAAATAVGAKFPNAKVEAMPATPPTDAAKFAGMNVVVLLGRDLASSPIAGPAGTTATTATTATSATTAKSAATTTTVKK